MEYEGSIKAHSGWVTALACPVSQGQPDSVKLVSASRDKTLVAWRGDKYNEAETKPYRRLEGHASFVQDVALSADGDYAVSASWDRSLRLWDMKSGETLHKFFGHTRDVMSVAIAPNSRQIVSGGRDNKIMVWNVVGACMNTLDKDGHTDWVSCVRFSPMNDTPQVVSGSWDHTVKVWDMTKSTCKITLREHKSQVTCVTVSPDSSLFASASRDGVTKLWDMRRAEHLYELNSEQPINQICFSPNRYWLCAATESAIRIYDLETKETLAELVPDRQNGSKITECTAIAWSADGSRLYSGHTDNTIRVWRVIA